jgi:hypothetical protein
MHLNSLAASKKFAARLLKKCVWRMLSVCSFWKQRFNLVKPIIGFPSFFITGGLTHARKRLFGLHLMNTEDQLFQHKGLRTNSFSILDAGPSGSIQNPMINSDCCDIPQPRSFLGQ